MTFSARTERRGQTINQLAAEKRLHKILDKPVSIYHEDGLPLAGSAELAAALRGRQTTN